MTIVSHLIAIHSLVCRQPTGQFCRGIERTSPIEKERHPGISTITSAGNFMKDIPLGIVESSTVLICQNDLMSSIHISIGRLYYHILEINSRRTLSTSSTVFICFQDHDNTNDQYKNQRKQNNTSTQWYELHFSDLPFLEMISLYEERTLVSIL